MDDSGREKWTASWHPKEPQKKYVQKNYNDKLNIKLHRCSRKDLENFKF